jgi:hypothetical protein
MAKARLVRSIGDALFQHLQIEDSQQRIAAANLSIEET